VNWLAVIEAVNDDMTIEAKLGILAVLAYFIGAIPFGLVVGKIKGIDPRHAGSGNIGATNVGRLLGKRYFAIVFALDLLKGFIPMLVTSAMVRHIPDTQKPYLLWMLVGAAAVIGHLFPIYLKFNGGKGVATSAGLLLGMFPFLTLPGVVCMSTFVLVFKLTRTVSLGSIAAALAFAPTYIIAGLAFGWPVFGRQLPLLIFSLLLSSIIIYKHRSNIRRLIAGTEHVFHKEQA
jgi:glycerol-3-phosphate acyltransferase PlsY